MGNRLGAAAVFLSVCVVGLLAMVFTFGGPGLFLNIPGTRVNGIFFAEWQFMNFLVYVGGPTSALATVLMLGLLGDPRKR